MAKIQVKNLKELEKALKGKIHDGLFFSSNLQDKSAEFMHNRVISNVYDKFIPKAYERRGNDDNNTEAFSHMDNMQFTSVESSGNGIKFTLENTAEGNDSMVGNELVEMFENGIKSNWTDPEVKDVMGRVVSDPRPFIDDTISDMNKNKGELLDALRKDLSELGFSIRK